MQTQVTPSCGVQRRQCAAAMAGLWWLATTGNAAAAPTQSRFEPSMTVQGVPLVLNGAGTRYRAVFRVYEMGLYVPRKVGTAEELLAVPGPKAIRFFAMRDRESTDIGLALVKGMRANATPEETRRHVPSMSRLIEVFSVRSRMAPGGTFAMEFHPDKGTVFFIENQQQGAAVGDAEFFNMALKIWVGGSPVEPLLKDALLGA